MADPLTLAWPSSPSARDAFIVAHRPAHTPPDPWRLNNLLIEEEPDQDWIPRAVAAIFLTGRECPWHCAMCDLWQHTSPDRTPHGALVSQLDAALQQINAGPMTV